MVYTIVPLPKSSMKDPSNPLQYRSIFLLSIPYKLLTKILNNVLCEWLESLVDAQCGFRAGRSTTEQVLNICIITETRQQLGLSTFAAFIDFQKAYDSIQHNLLWHKLEQNLVPINFCMTA